MMFYIPERIYDLVKDTPEFKEVQDLFEKAASTTNTLLSAVKLEYNDKFNQAAIDLISKNFDKLKSDGIIPNSYFTELDVCFHTEWDKIHLLNLYNIKGFDVETRLFILSNIINWSYEDRTYPKYQKMYKDLYESYQFETIKKCSIYIHLKYMVSDTEDYIRSLDPTNVNLLDAVKVRLDWHLNRFKDIVDKDILNYEYVETLSHCITLMVDLCNDDDRLAYKMLNSTTVDEELFDIQYGDNSMLKVSILGREMELALAVRDMKSTCMYLDLLFETIDNNLSNITTLLRGLGIYDKDMLDNYIAEARRVLKMSKEVGYEFSNIDPLDEKFLLSEKFNDLFGSEYNNDPAYDSFIRTITHYDDWFTNGNETIEVLYKYYNNQYQDIKNTPDFDIHSILKVN